MKYLILRGSTSLPLPVEVLSAGWEDAQSLPRDIETSVLH